MKTGRYLAAMFALSLSLPALARADDLQDATANDPSTVPKAFQPRTEITPQQQEAVAAEQKKTAEDKDWLLRGYEEQMQSRAKDSASPDDSDNVYTEVTGDKDLAKAAGLPFLDLSKKGDGLDLDDATHQEQTPSGTDAGNLQPKPAVDSPPPANSNDLFGPAITPLAPPSPVGMENPSANFAQFLPPASSPLDFKLAPMPQEQVVREQAAQLKVDDPGALDTPGMTAEESDPTAMPVDPLPGEINGDQKEEHHVLSLDVPEVQTSTDHLQLPQIAPPTVPGAQAKKVSAVPPSALLLKPRGATDDMVPDPTPMRNRPDDPYDILR